MQLFTSLPQINSLPASDLKEHLEHRYRTLYEAWIRLSHRGHGLVFSAGSVASDLDHNGYQLLPGCARRGCR